MFDTILHFLAAWSIRATALAAVAATVLWCLRLKDSTLRLAAWTAIFAGIVLIPFATFLAPGLPVAIPDFFAARSAPAMGEPSVDSTLFDTPLAARSPSGRLTPSQVAVAVWLLVAFVLLARLAAGVWLGRRLTRAARPVDSGVRESNLITVPVTIGILRPTILLPTGWRDWETSKLEAVLAHERSHVERRDTIRQFSTHFYRAICWFHPLSWWLHRHLADLAETASDDAALKVVSDRTLYAETLVGFFASAPKRVSWARAVNWEGVAMARPGIATKRVERILDSARPLAGSLTRAAAAALIVFAIPLVYLASSIRPAWAAQPQPQAAAETPYQKWLQTDVVYIISEEERTAFNRLTTDEERQAFIEQFWLRRGAGAKEEHYRRIAYSNERFMSWKSDRGRAYIVYGPADEIESHPKDPTPSESWLYRHLDLGDNIILEFQDLAGNGEYRLKPVLLPVSKISIDVSTPSLARVSIPLSSATPPISLHGIVRNPTGKPVFVFEEVSGARVYLREISLPPGQYILDLTLKSGSATSRQAAGFLIH